MVFLVAVRLKDDVKYQLFQIRIFKFTTFHILKYHIMKKPVKILGKGELKAKINLEVNAVSQSAKEKIESVGGSIKLI